MEKSTLLSYLEPQEREIAEELITSQIIDEAYYKPSHFNSSYRTNRAENLHLYLQLNKNLDSFNRENVFMAIQTELHINKIIGDLNLHGSREYSLDYKILKIKFGFRPHDKYRRLTE